MFEHVYVQISFLFIATKSRLTKLTSHFKELQFWYNKIEPIYNEYLTTHKAALGSLFS